MATRNLTKRFEALRQQRISRRGAPSSLSHLSTDSYSDGKEALLGKDNVVVNVGLGSELPPEWVDIVEGIQKDVATIKQNIQTLRGLHDQRLKITFGEDEADCDRDVNDLTQEITSKLKKCENSVKRIATVGNQRGDTLPKQERVVRLNVMRALATELQEISAEFRRCQKDFFHRLKGRGEGGANKFFDDSKQSLSLEEALDRGTFTEAELAELQDLDQRADEREKEILKIAQSVNDLASIFRELSVLVIEQGTILDRIDYNIEQTLVKVRDGKGELVKADKYSKKAGRRKCFCILFLLLTVIIESLILMGRHGVFKNKKT